MTGRGLLAGGAVVAALGAIALAVQFASTEWRAIQFLAASPEGQVLTLAAGPVTLPPSIRTGRQTLLACEDALLGDLFEFQPADARGNITKHCAALAESARRRSPQWALAHYLTALTAHTEGDVAMRDAALLRSQDLAPHEGWLAARRFDLARKDLASNALRATLDADVAVLLDSEAGRAQLVSAYLADDALRAEIETAEARHETD